MAGLGGKNWTFEEEVTSSDVNGYLADQVVMRFADATARTAGFGGAGEPTLTEGMLSYLDDANRVDLYNGSVWKSVSQVLQVVQTVLTSTYTHSSGQTFTNVTGLSVSITPSSASNKILIGSMVSFGGNNGSTWLKLTGGSTASFVGDAASNRTRIATAALPAVNTQMNNAYLWYLDSPAVTTAITYQVQIAAGDNVTTTYVNRTPTDTDNATYTRGASTIIAIEVAA